MTGLGERLKEARNKKGYTLDDLQEITKIQKRYLSGIENEEYTGMPGSFYIRAFIKQYAEAVDLDADEMLALYKGSSGKQEELEEEEQQQQMTSSTLSRSRTRSTRQFNEVMPKIIVALFIIVILLVLTFLWRHKASTKSDLEINTDNPVQVEDQSKPKQEDQGKGDDEKDEEATGDDDSSDTDDATDEDENNADDDEQDETQSLEYLSSSGEDATYKLSNSDTFKLEIRTNGPSWIGVMDENQNELSPEARTMDAGEKLELDVSDVEKVRIRVGRTGETEIYVNGELLEYESDTITQNIHIEYEQE